MRTIPCKYSFLCVTPSHSCPYQVQATLYKRQNRVASAKKDPSQSPWFIVLGTPKDSGHFQSYVLSHSQDWNSKLLCAEWIKLGQGDVILPALPHFSKSTPALGTSLWGRFSNSSPGPDTQIFEGQHSAPPAASCSLPWPNWAFPNSTGQCLPACFEATPSSLRNPDTHLMGFFLNSTRQQNT